MKDEIRRLSEEMARHGYVADRAIPTCGPECRRSVVEGFGRLRR